MPLIPGNRYTKSDLYTIFNIPSESQKGPWNTGYTEYNNEVFIFANIGVAGRTGHDYPNYWDNGNLVWRGKTKSHINQPLIKLMLKPETVKYLFTRERDRDPFTFHGVVTIEDIDEHEVPVKVVWKISTQIKLSKTVPIVNNKVSETTLSKNIKQAENDDVGKRVLKSYRLRKGQKKFSDNLFIVCGGQCCITGCTVASVLHACHLIPHAQSGNNNTTNGLLLRSDIHDLFDLHLIGIHPTTFKIHVKKQLKNSEYASLKGKTLLPRINEEPNPEALKKRWQLFRSHGK